MSLDSANKMAEKYQASVLKVATTAFNKLGPLTSGDVLSRWKRKQYTPETRRFIVERCLTVLSQNGQLMKIGRYYGLPTMTKVEIDLPEDMKEGDKKVVRRYGPLVRDELLAQLLTPTTLAGLLALPAPTALAAAAESSRSNFTRALLRWLRHTGAVTYSAGFWSATRTEN